MIVTLVDHVAVDSYQAQVLDVANLDNQQAELNLDILVVDHHMVAFLDIVDTVLVVVDMDIQDVHAVDIYTVEGQSVVVEQDCLDVVAVATVAAELVVVEHYDSQIVVEKVLAVRTKDLVVFEDLSEAYYVVAAVVVVVEEVVAVHHYN